jgi:uracil-DNA glycosylase
VDPSGGKDNMTEIIDSLYISCMNCQINCKGVWIDLENGIPPRGFYYRNSPVSILVVSKNPGHPLNGESMLYKGKKGKDIFYAYRQFQNDLYRNLNNNKEQSTRFHKNMYRYLSYFLDIPNDIDEIYKQVAHTDLLKCSTRNEQAKIPEEMFDKCYKQYLLKEIELLKPRLILALGREVERFLRKKQFEHNTPIIYIKHPSYYYKKEDEKVILKCKKDEISKILGRKNT